jgi:hypothetical protein
MPSGMIDVKVEGLEELHRDLVTMAEHIAPKALQPMLLEIAKPFATKLSAVPPPLGPTGHLREGVKAWSPRITPNRPFAMARAGVRYKIAPHVHLVEYGTAERYTKSGARRGAARARLFISPLAERELPGMLRQVIDGIWERIYKDWGGPSVRGG